MLILPTYNLQVSATIQTVRFVRQINGAPCVTADILSILALDDAKVVITTTIIYKL